ncbi:hypothetical protein CLIB1423_03S02124 [[Candida] railenensis]|uniref:G-protein coupled receptors family 1 profile domain-containing protein n=1 Tax=[Candida] railenensis TaxID=45579 RepID=A0A9P0QMQ1_9ASCO|nr:hypothetical protein CLIB1423_03S02124 [[Candida] railenensis]
MPFLSFIYDSLGDGSSFAGLFSRDVVNQASQFTYHQQFVQRVLAIASSTSSIVFCLIAIYLFLSIDPRRLVFRHHLICFLIFYDFVKAIILLIYPTRVLSYNTAYYSNNFCQVVGFFTATAIEGADFAILAFAVHTFLLLFHTQFSVKLENGRTEGGLYIYRSYVYVLSVLIPLVLASLAYVNGTGYNSYVCWCSLPQKPVWYRLVLSWLPRYLIIITIFTVYCMIYFHVIKEFKSLSGAFSTMHATKSNKERGDDRPTFFSALMYSIRAFRNNYFPKIVLPNQYNKKNGDKSGSRRSSSTPDEGRTETSSDEELNMSELHGKNLENFRKRQKIIEKQMKSIFIYPIAYIFLWLFPFILYVTQINYEEANHPIYWLNCMGAFFQPFNGFVDSLVFFYREIPWEYTIMKNFEKEHGAKIAAATHMATVLDSESMATSARLTKQSISMSMAVNINEYSLWRQYFHMLKLPLFELPTEENISKFQAKFLDQLHRGSSSSKDNSEFNGVADGAFEPSPRSLNVAGYGAGSSGLAAESHDFSNILSGDTTEREFRSALEDFSLDFSQKRNSFASNQSKRISISNKSSRSRQLSIVDPNMTRLGEILGPQNNNNNNHNHNNTNNNANSDIDTSLPYNNIIKGFRGGSGGGSVSGTPKRSQSTSRAGDLSSSVAEENEMDFLEFLKKGPS